MRPRIAVIAVNSRTQEYARRAFRLLGCHTLVFMDVDDFLAMGERALGLSMIFLEHPPAQSPPEPTTAPPDLGERVRALVGDAMPIVHAVPVPSGRVLSGFRNIDLLLPGLMPFTPLCRALGAFLRQQGLPVGEARLEFGAYRFCIDSGRAYVGERAIALKPDQFDLALELFFHQGVEVSRTWLRTVLPKCRALRLRAPDKVDAMLEQLRDVLELSPARGWDLQLDPGLACTLVRVPARGVRSRHRAVDGG